MIIANNLNFAYVVRISFESISRNVNRVDDWLVLQCKKNGVLSFNCNFFLKKNYSFVVSFGPL